MNKQKLQSIISKYYLNGLVESVKWVTQDNNLNVKFNSPNRDMIGEVQFEDINLPNSEIAIYDTSQLDKLINITADELDLILIKSGKNFNKLIINDKSYELIYPLADLFLIKNPGKVNVNSEFDIKCGLNSDIMSSIIKAKNAIQNDSISIELEEQLGEDKSKIVLIFGDETSNHTNKIKYKLNTLHVNPLISKEFSLPFNSEVIKSILNVNKDALKSFMSINTNGLLYFEFHGDGWYSNYYLVRKAEN